MGMRVRFTTHALQRGAERGITRWDALWVISNPVTSAPGYGGMTNLWGYTPGTPGKRIRVTIELKTMTVITLAIADRRSE